MPPSKDDIRQEIAREEARLAELERAREQASSRIARLKADLDLHSVGVAEPLPLVQHRGTLEAPQTSAQKVRLFQSLFRGRPDVFPTRFVSKRTGKPGYSPACGNKWEPGICALRSGGKCGDCTNQAFSPVVGKAILGFVRHIVVLQGGTSAKKRRQVAEKLAAIPDDEERLVLATGRYIGEGFDDARLDTLFLAMPISWKGTLIQYSGRLHRHHPGKREVRIYDYVDRDVPMLARMFEKRLRAYRAIGYAREEAPLGFAESPRESVVEYDEAVRQFDEEV